jgi:catechol 2,3-dioxygenase-like lactoylglutathione lyase family enzyme
VRAQRVDLTIGRDGRSAVPPLTGVLETVLYSTDLTQAEHFYTQVLGFLQIGKAPGRHLFFRVGSSVFLVFDPRATNISEGPLPAHGADGGGHVCFLAGGDDYQRWKGHLASHGVAIIHESRWGDDGLSFYFRDPAGNLLEIANADFWG